MRQALEIAIDYMNDRLEDHDCKYQRHPATEAERINILADIETVKEALAQSEQEPVAFITPLMEQQLFDDWCPYKGNPDPCVVWAAAIDAVNGLLIGATPPQRKPLTDKQRKQMWHKANPAHRAWASFDWYSQGVADTEAAHGIKGEA